MSRSLALIILALVASMVWAQTPAPDAAVPIALRDWRAWVLKDLDYRACPFLAGHEANSESEFICAWPGRLTLASGADGATFTVHWRVEANAWVTLPGNTEHWPQQVSVNAQHQPVLEHGGVPAMWLTPGSYEIAGHIPWRERPQALDVPQAIGLIALSVDGKAIAPIQRDGTQVTLGRSTTAAPEADNLEVRVYRKLSDGVPAQLTTQIMIGVSGQAREEVLGPVLPDGFVPLALEGEWPARLDADGKMHVQVQPGAETFTLQARAVAPLTGVTAHLPAAAWPKQEIWSYDSQSHLRVTAASSAVQVDPRQSEVPAEWQALPAFALGDGAKLTIEERSRGLAPDEANRLTLQREAWLDFSGEGWYARDHVGGTMAQGWRFDVAAPFTLEQATARNSHYGEGNAGEPLLITRGTKPELSGVEWRTPNVDLAAGVHVAAPASMPVAGWRQTFDNVQATLHFPFGYKLLAAPGADSAGGSWIAGWSLLDVFLCAIVALLAWRLFGLIGAVLVSAYLLLGYQEAGSPLWSLLIVLGLTLIVRALPEGKLERAANNLRRVALVVLALWTLPFVAQQVRDALYPQLEQGGYATAGFADRGILGGAMAPAQQNAPAGAEMKAEMRQEEPVEAPPTPMSVPMPASPPPPMMRAAPKVVEKVKPTERETQKSQSLESIVVTGSRIERSDIVDHYSQTTVVQTGKGMPSWNLGSTAWLSWSGPVVASQSVHLLIAPPWLVRGLRLVLVALLAWVILRLFRSTPLRRASGIALGAGIIVLCAALSPARVQAQGYPSDELLQQLRLRLTQAPKCAPGCASIAEAQISANGDGVSVALEAHIGERVALPLPGDQNAVMLKSVQVDGVADEAIARDASGAAWLALNRGVHRVQLEFVTDADKVALAFALKPARVLFQGHGWDASGLSDDRLLTETLNLARAREGADEKLTTGAQQFPPYVEVTRSLTLGLEWSSNTHVRRLAPKTGGFSVSVPILAGEHVTTPGRKVVDGHIEAAIADGAEGTDWNANLKKGAQLTFTAPALTDHVEVWRVTVSPTWHVEFSGVPGVGLEQGDDANDYRDFEFHPLPGETLTLNVTSPDTAQGAQRAIDAVMLQSETGQHATTHALSFTLRASQGGDQQLTLPKDAEVLAVTRDNETLNLRALDGKLTLPVAPGAHRYTVRMRFGDGIAMLVRTPLFALGLPAANISIVQQLPGDRWLLAAWGPAVGPAVLYWGELIVMALVAYALSRTRRTRLKFRDWLLLGLGFSTFSWIALAVVVGWLFAFHWRANAEMSAVRWRFNLLQVALVVLTVVASIALASAIPQGLLGQPDMHVTGNGSYAQYLQWFADRSSDTLPQAAVVSLPLWLYKVLMLAWALWLANAVIGWLRDGFAAWTQGGYWRAPVKPTVAESAAAPNKLGAENT